MRKKGQILGLLFSHRSRWILRLIPFPLALIGAGAFFRDWLFEHLPDITTYWPFRDQVLSPLGYSHSPEHRVGH
ncbi:MAG: hypothetical protein HYX88_01140 [Chloroflexi bacterium]|nr:hypothetical protein [Chloroflexota bacterium]